MTLHFGKSITLANRVSKVEKIGAKCTPAASGGGAGGDINVEVPCLCGLPASYFSIEHEREAVPMMRSWGD
jgi:hypothetical protein